MYNDFSIAISSTKNILRIKSEFDFIEHVTLTSTLSAIPFTDAFMNSYPTQTQSTSEILTETLYGDFRFLWDFSDIPIILYEINYHSDLGGKGDEAWLFADHKLFAHYLDKTTSIGVALNKALADSTLDLGKIPHETLNRLHIHVDEPISFSSLGFKFKKNPEDFFH